MATHCATNQDCVLTPRYRCTDDNLGCELDPTYTSPYTSPDHCGCRFLCGDDGVSCVRSEQGIEDAGEGCGCAAPAPAALRRRKQQQLRAPGDPPMCADNNNVVSPCMTNPKGGVCDTTDADPANHICRFGCDEKEWREYKGACSDPGACCRYGELSAQTYMSCSQADPFAGETVERTAYGCVITNPRTAHKPTICDGIDHDFQCGMSLSRKRQLQHQQQKQQLRGKATFDWLDDDNYRPGRWYWAVPEDGDDSGSIVPDNDEDDHLGLRKYCSTKQGMVVDCVRAMQDFPGVSAACIRDATSRSGFSCHVCAPGEEADCQHEE
jgi:hypothetical protein